MRLGILMCATLTILTPVGAQAVEVYPGCAMPSTKSGAHTFFVDPINGSDNGDGSTTKPWKTLSIILGVANKFVFTRAWSNATQSYAPVNPNGPVKPGDTVLLQSGNHGNLRILNSFNDDFITVAAAPGATPVISQLQLISSSKWAFHDIKFQGETQLPRPSDLSKKPSDSLVSLGGGDYTGTSHDFVLYNNTFSTVDDTSRWSEADWIGRPPFTLLRNIATCSSLVDNDFYNAFDVLGLFRPKQLAKGNSIRKFVNDGIDVTASNIIVKDNTIKDNVNSRLDGYHSDAIQGWSNIVNGAAAINNNVTIDGNMIIKTGNSSITYMQGISFFDGKWDHLTIRNNSIVTNTINGIVLFGGTNSLIINNTMVGSDNDALPLLRLGAAKDGTLPSNVVVRNNITPYLAVAVQGVTSDNNIVAGGRYIDLVNGVAANVTASDMRKRNIMIKDPTSLFVTLDLAANAYDLRLKSGSPAIGIGSRYGAPSTDINGKPRGTVIDLGAYAFSAATAAASPPVSTAVTAVQ